MEQPLPNTSRKTRQRYAVAHRYLGLVASVIVLMLALTGILLNHAGSLESLGEPVESGLLLDWYGLSPDGSPRSYRVGDVWVVGLERQVYLDARAISTIDSSLIGALGVGPLLVLATPDSLLLFSNDPEAAAVDRLGSASLPGRLQRIGSSESGNLLAEVDGRVYIADDDLLEWQPHEQGTARAWSTPLPLPAAEREAVLESHRGEGLTRFRVVSDLHSGRILGEYGFLLMDAAALVLLLLTGSGIHNWFTTRKPVAGPLVDPSPIQVQTAEPSEPS
jgi:hypothetical protein